MTNAIQLHNARHPRPVEAEHVYFAFPSGRLSYDCISCKAQCCRGYGYHLHQGPELDRHLAVRPAVRFFIDRDHALRDQQHMVSNCPPACFFLTKENLCGLQVEAGPDAKPETCRLFPFNNLRRVGQYLIVAPHSWLCPLSVVASGSTSPASDHTTLLEAMSASGLLAFVHEGARPAGDLDALIALERRVVALAEDFLDLATYPAFLAAQVSLGRSQPASRSKGSRVSDAIVLSGFLETLSKVLGLPPECGHACDPALARVLIAVTPAMRAELLFARPEAPAVDSERVPYVLGGLYLLCCLAMEAGMQDVTYQAISRLLTTYRPLLLLLAHVDCEMTWAESTLIPWPLRDDVSAESSYLAIARALVPSVQRKTCATLGEILCDSLPHHGLARIQFLKQVAGRLGGRISPAGDVPGRSRRSQRFRSMLQRLLLANIRHDWMVALAAHVSASNGVRT